MAPTVFKQDQLKHLPQADRQLFTHFGLGEAIEQPFECVHHAFEHHAHKHPYSFAVEDFENKISYVELNRQANCLATHLRSKGIGPGSRVCLLVERSILMVVGILGVLKAGAAYVPLDGNVVADKTLNHALKDSGSSLVLVLRKFVHRVGETPIMCLEDTLCDSPYSTHCVKPQDLATRNDSAYIIYTSGTTGVPKGVDVMHKNVTNLVCMEPGNLKMRPGVKVSQLMNISFDMAAWEILGSMCNGATLCLRGKTSKEWRAVMKTVDVVVATPSMLAPHKPEDYPTIKVVAVAGEPCPKALADSWAKQAAFYNCCGPTEITIVNTMHHHKPGKALGIGGPTPNNTVYILDEKMQPVKIGEMGIMWAGGAGITRGYLNLPDKTSEKYGRDPFLGDGSMMFNTGDLGRWLPDGDLEHLGRVDHQVKVKGFRVELDGVAAAMETTPGVKVATAILIKGELWGFFAPSNVSVEDVKAATARVQPHYAVPTKYVKLDTFPETANGKTDKRALEKLALESGEGGAAAPTALAAPPAKRAFKQDPLKDLSPADKQLFNTFGLGESVKPAFELVHRAFEHHARAHPDTIAVEDFGNKITYAELDRQSDCLATRLRAGGVAPGSRVCLLVERSILMVVGIIAVLKAGGAYVPLDGNVVADKTLNHALKDSGSSLVLVQQKFIHRVGTTPIMCLEESICEHENPHCQRPEDLAKTTDSAYIIYTSGTTGVPKGVDVMHKNVTNLVCMAPGSLKMGHGVRVSQLMNISFDMAAWEILGSMCNGATLCLRGKTSKEWRAVMKTVDVVVATPSMLAPHKPEEYPNIKVVAVAGEPCPKTLADNWARTASFYNCCGPTEITIVNTMHLHSAGIDLGIGGPTPNNTVYVLDANMKPVKIGEMGVMWAGGDGITRGYLNLPDKTAEKYLRDPFLDDGSMMFNTGDLGRWLPNGDLEHLGRVDHQVKVKGFRVELDGVAAAMETTPGVKVATAILINGELWGFYTASNVSVTDVKAATARVQPHYAVPTRYISLDSFPETANGKVDKRVLEKMALESGEGGAVAPAKRAFKDEPLKDLSGADKQLFKMFGLGETVKPAFDCVHHAFEHHARAHSDTIAVEDFGHKITFAELDRQSNCLATRLRASGVKPGSRVCLLVERSILMVVGILSVLKAGGAYVPLDGNVVADKTLNHALKDSGSSLVLVQRKFIHRIGTTPILCLEDSICESDNPHCTRPEDLAKTTDSAYIIYTSGTTGVPKGVDVMHKNVTNLVCVAPGNLKMAHGVRVSQLMNISFDMAAWEILGSMCNGATLCLRGKTSKEWRAVMKTVDVVVATPSMLAPHKPEDYPNIKVVAVAGEPCPRALADNWARTVSFYNCCGPTEITIVNTMHLHSPAIDLGIGGPTPNNTVYVLDANMKPVKIGEMGVMWAGGNGITRGYLNLPDKTAEKYQRDPFLDDGSLMFNTGDLGRWLPNGDLEHLGRVDHQVKVKGFRVELDGVAAAMETTPGVKVATALLIDSELWGFFAPKAVSVEDVKAATSKVQPHYAVPTRFIGLDKFPETANGKSDKRALEQLARDSLKAAPLAPQSIPPPAPVVVQTVPQVIYETPVTQNHVAQPPMSEKPAQEGGLASSRASVVTYDSTTTVGAAAPAGANVMQAPSRNATLVNVSIPVEKKIEPGPLEGQTSIWAGYEQDVIPEKTQGRVIRNLRHQIFYLYRRLFGIVFLTNLGLFIWYAVKGANAKEVGTVVVGNLFGAIMMRQDYVIDAFFITFTSIPPSWPLWIRRIAARVYHIGGLHSGAGASGTLWLILFCVQATREVVAGRTGGVGVSGATLTVTYVVLALLLMILIFAYPALRKKFHDSFEATHRFLGWSATGLVWIQIVLLTNDYRGAVPLHTALLHSAPLWLIAVATLSLALPWLRLKKVPVRCEKLSNHAVRMYFDYATPGAGSFVRLSDAPLTEWHSFATMPEPGKRGFSLVVSRAGDWTVKMIANPPTHIWKRGIPTYGVMKIAPMFRRLVVVATGSGIGPCTAAIMEKKVPMRVLWTAPSVRGTFGDKLVDSILEANPEAVIYDTRKHGKPDMVKLTYRLVKEFNAEAVVIISNQSLTEKVVYGMMSRGIPAFGAIWDS